MENRKEVNKTLFLVSKTFKVTIYIDTKFRKFSKLNKDC